MKTPLISCIMPTADRPNYIPLAIFYFLNQDYDNAELIVIDNGKHSIEHLVPQDSRMKYVYTNNFKSIGDIRNQACALATGEIIVHWDDDDYYANDWLSREFDALNTSKADIVGLNSIVFYSPLVKKFWRYENKDVIRPWLSGATLAYRKKFWEKHPFKDINIGEDYDFVWNSGGKTYAFDYPNGFIATLHAGNTTLKPFENPRHKKHAIEYMHVEYQGDAQNP